MSDSLSPDHRNPLSEDEQPQQEVTPTKGIVHDDLGDPETALDPTRSSHADEPGGVNPEHIHERRIRESGGATPEDSGNAPPELASDDRSLLQGHPKTPDPRSS